jgi:hypothetical protein
MRDRLHTRCARGHKTRGRRTVGLRRLSSYTGGVLMSSTRSPESSRKPYNPALELATWLSTQTERRQLRWDSQDSIVSTKLRDATTIQFLVHSAESCSQDWRLFTVHDAYGHRLLRITPNATSVNDSPLMSTGDALFTSITEHCSALPRTQPTPSVSVPHFLSSS